MRLVKHCCLLWLLFSAEAQALTPSQEAVRTYNRQEILLQQGRSYLRAHRYQKSLTKFDQLLTEFPEHARGYYLRGNTYYYLQQREPACADWERACELGVCDGWNFATFEKVCVPPPTPESTRRSL
jgi:tetratricopeptide (TPR) repeat protein